MYRFGLIGYPVGHSLSPWIHGQFFKKANLQGTYEKIEINPNSDFDLMMQSLKEKNLDGFNITVPYKAAILPYLDEISDEAKRIGAVNTVVIKNNRWTGYNTDGIGYVRSLEQYFPNMTKKDSILILGAGGAARGIYYALSQLGYAHIDIANRTLQSASDIKKGKKDFTQTAVLTIDQATTDIHTYDIIIQTTSVGMKPNIDEMIVPLNHIKDHAIFSDIVYQPLETAFLTRAKQLGANIHHGHTMLVYQAQYAFELWTEKLVDIGDMDDKLKQILEGE